MAVDNPAAKYRGFWKYYNSETMKGRIGAVYVTYGVTGAVVLFLYVRSKLRNRQAIQDKK